MSDAHHETGSTRPVRGSIDTRARLTVSTLLVCPALIALLAILWAVNQQRTVGSVLLDERAEVAAEVGRGIAQVVLTQEAGPLTPDALRTLEQALNNAFVEMNVSRCVLRLPDNRVMIDTAGTPAPIGEFAEEWPAEASFPVPDADAYLTAQIRGLGPVQVEVEMMPEARAGVGDWVVLGAIVAIGAVLLAAVGRIALPEIRGFLAVQSALSAVSSGETEPQAMRISPRFGTLAGPWNRLLDERADLEKQGLDRRVEQIGAGAKSDDLVQRACDAMPTGIVVCDQAGKIRYANGAAGILLGSRRDDLVGVILADRIEAEQVRELIGTVVLDGTGRRGAIEVEQNAAGNRSILRYAVMRLEQGNTRAGLVLIEDVTQQRTADQARDEFVEQATHELRTPLTTIRMHLEPLVEEDVADEQARRESLNIINQESLRLERMVGDMLSVAEIEAGSLKLHVNDVRLDQLLTELRAAFEHQAAEKSLTLVFDLPPKLPVIRGDRDKIMQTLHNLLANAMKYTPAGGTVTVRLEAGEETLRIQVADTGIGIAPEDASRVFERFYRAQDNRVSKITGSGLGLALAQEIVRLHGGEIGVESELDHGSTFTLQLPVRAEAA